MSLDLQPDRPDELEHLDDDRVGQLGFAQDVGEQRLRVLRVGHLAAQQSGHHLDAGERVLQLVRDARGHLAERREAIAQALALLELFDLRQVLEEQHRADRRPIVALHLRERVADHAVEVLQPRLRAVRQVAQLERAGEDAQDLGPIAQDVGERAADVVRRAARSEKIRYASAFISASVPSRRKAMTPLRMLLTMWRKNRSSGTSRSRRRRGRGPVGWGRREQTATLAPRRRASRVGGACGS